MLKIIVPETEKWDELKQEFIHSKEQTITLEHSLVSISKWEAKWHVPYLTNDKKSTKTPEQVLDYIKCMTITQNVDDDVYRCLTRENYKEINAYIENPMTATWFREEKESKSISREIITSEKIYSWMVGLEIPFSCEKWHINRLLTLIRCCSENNKEAQGGRKKLSKKELAARNASLNAQRKAKLNTKG